MRRRRRSRRGDFARSSKVTKRTSALPETAARRATIGAPAIPYAAVVSLSLFLFATADVSTPIPLVVVYMVLFGAGLGIFASPNMSSIMGSVPAVRRGIASGFRATFFNVGFVLSLNLAILAMASVTGYGLVTDVIRSGSAVGLDVERFQHGLQTAFLWMATVNTAAILPSLLRGRRVRNARPTPATAIPEI